MDDEFVRIDTVPLENPSTSSGNGNNLFGFCTSTEMVQFSNLPPHTSSSLQQASAQSSLQRAAGLAAASMPHPENQTSQLLQNDVRELYESDSAYANEDTAVNVVPEFALNEKSKRVRLNTNKNHMIED
jgi:hypothetical protein